MFRWWRGAGASSACVVVLATAFGACRQPPRATLASASASVSAAARPAVPFDACDGWTPSKRSEGTMTGSLELFCTRFGPCPSDPSQAVQRFPTLRPRIRTLPDLLVVTYTLGFFEYVFDRRGRLVGARASTDVAQDFCGRRNISVHVGGVAAPREGGRVCGFVPGRDLSRGEACRCPPPEAGIGVDEGLPPVQTSLDCLYEFGVAGGVCETTLAGERRRISLLRTRATNERSRFTASERFDACGRTRVTSVERGIRADCAYAPDGSLVELRWGKRFVSDGFEGPCSN